MRFDILTIFPELLKSPFEEGIIRRALGAGRISIGLHNIRDHARDRHHMTDDRPFGGGEGMVMKPEPLSRCLDSVPREGRSRVILLSPRGKTFSQREAERLSAYDQLILVCGRYEGVDERFTRQSVDEEVSIGDYILTGGELAAMVLVDAITRLLPGVLGCSDSAARDTFSQGLLKHPQYTRPREFQGDRVPGELLSGDHRKIEHYRFVESVRLTLERRPELLLELDFSPDELRLLDQAGLLSRVKITKKEMNGDVQSLA